MAEISLPYIFGFMAVVVLVAGVSVLFMSKSDGPLVPQKETPTCKIFRCKNMIKSVEINTVRPVDSDEFEDQMEEGISELDTANELDDDEEMSFDFAKIQQDLLEDPSLRFADDLTTSKPVTMSWSLGQGGKLFLN